LAPTSRFGRIALLGPSGSLLGTSGSLWSFWEPNLAKTKKMSFSMSNWLRSAVLAELPFWEPLRASGSLWERASASLWEPLGASGGFGAQNGQNNLLFGIPIRRGRMGSRNEQIYQIYIWEPLGATLCIDSQAGTLWEPLGGSLWKPFQG
jgi:hypothetical protein